MKGSIKIQLLLEESLYEIRSGTSKAHSLNRLLSYIQNSPRIRKDSHPYYLEALDKTFEWLIRNLEKFKPQPDMSVEESFFRWINGYLRNRILDLKIDSYKSQTVSLDQPVYSEAVDGVSWVEQISNSDFSIPKLSGLDDYIEQLRETENRTVVFELEKYVSEDPSNLLKDLHIRNSRECNCQYIRLNRK